jgi:hypothetical protein
MASGLREYELVLHGVGYTGKLVAEWVTTHLPEDLKWAIAGRNAKKLQDVVDELQKLRPGRKQPSKICTIRHRDVAHSIHQEQAHKCIRH